MVKTLGMGRITFLPHKTGQRGPATRGDSEIIKTLGMGRMTFTQSQITDILLLTLYLLLSIAYYSYGSQQLAIA